MADQSTTKVTLFLYDEDIEVMKRRFGYGWSAEIREVIHTWLKQKMIKTRVSPEE